MIKIIGKGKNSEGMSSFVLGKKSGCAFLHIHFKWQSLLDAQFLLHILRNAVLVYKNVHVQVTPESIALSTP